MLRPHRAFALRCGLVLVALGATACFDWDSYDPRLHAAPGAGGSGADGAGGTGGTGNAEGGADGGAAGAGATGGSGGTGGSEPCTGDAFECLADGSARECDGALWQELGSCPLGCDEDARACRVPSNVDADLLATGAGSLETADAIEFVIDTDSGEITRDGAVWRQAGEGVDGPTGIAFDNVSQGGGAPALGVFTMGSLVVAQGAALRGEGSSALVLLVDGDAVIDGLISVAADASVGGPGGFAGGAPGANGGGACGGLVGTGNYSGPVDDGYCNSGSSGAGFGAPGGAGGDCTCAAPLDFTGAVAGSGTCGTLELVPLLGGSSGAGGTLALNAALDADPGPGGGGGGALQISASGSISIGATGRIDAGGGGGGETVNGGGAGGGAGGAVLLEAPAVSIAVGSVLAANGGGGGGGDCL